MRLKRLKRARKLMKLFQGRLVSRTDDRAARHEVKGKSYRETKPFPNGFFQLRILS